tara:strand:+ start:5060 stop:5554 length:495 start_codon:yes stop_codon:yes gene_type:complete
MTIPVLLNNIENKNKGFNRRLTINYWITSFKSYAISFLENLLDGLIDKTVSRVIENRVQLLELYQVANDIQLEEAREAYPHIINVRKIISKQNNNFANIDYAGREDLKVEFTKLVKLVNRIEARIYSKTFKKDNSEPIPDYIKKQVISNSQEIIGNALLKEANC